MPGDLIGPDHLPGLVRSRQLLGTPDDWSGPSIRGYRLRPSDVMIPPMQDYMIVAYRRGGTPMRRKMEGRWIEEDLGPGDVSLLTRAADAHWIWLHDIEVVHVYLSHEELTGTCREMYEREVRDIDLFDEVKADDPLLHRTTMHLAHEAARGGVGSRLLVDSLAVQLSVHILRRHAHVLFREHRGADGLTFRQTRAVRDFVQEHLHEDISLVRMAASIGLSRYHFARQFKKTTGTTAHEYVLAERVARARMLLERTSTPLLEISDACGFADQSHMTRVFRRRVGTTPGRYRTARP